MIIIKTIPTVKKVFSADKNLISYSSSGQGKIIQIDTSLIDSESKTIGRGESYSVRLTRPTAMSSNTPKISKGVLLKDNITVLNLELTEEEYNLISDNSIENFVNTYIINYI